jgi:methyltransferase (TIGR00027 family)
MHAPEVGPSETARRVAAYRLGVDRRTGPGDPAADEALARDVTGEGTREATRPGSEVMARYVRARTGFFDTVVVNGLERGATQVVIVGAGYDGRALRYHRPGVRWWEVDREATQADKRDRLARLGIACDHIRFVPHDLERPGLAAALVAAGFLPDGVTVVVCEGVALYLSSTTIERTLAEVRTLAAPGTRLAMSVSGARSGDAPGRRERLKAAVALLGEPALSEVDVDRLAALARSARWQPVEISDRASRAGFAVLGPRWDGGGGDPSVSLAHTARFTERMLTRTGVESLPRHLAAVHGVEVRATLELDLGVHRVDLVDGRRWIARVFPAARPHEAVRGDAALLSWLDQQGFPAERPVGPEPVSVHEGQGVLVTQFVAGSPVGCDAASFHRLGRLLGQLHGMVDLPEPARRPGGAWHHAALDATPAHELAETRALLDAARSRVLPGDVGYHDELAEALAGLDAASDLPHALVHPDLVPGNVLVGEAGDAGDADEVTVVDWVGAGQGPRVVSLGCLLWAAAGTAGGAQAAASGYRESVTLEPEELDRLEAAMCLRPVVLACWMLGTGRGRVERVASGWRGQRAAIRAAAQEAAAVLSGSSGGAVDH